MRRIVRVSLDVVELRFPDSVYSLVVREQVRSATVREVCTLETGDFVREADMALALQIVEDVFQAAVGRTLGIIQTLDL